MILARFVLQLKTSKLTSIGLRFIHENVRGMDLDELQITTINAVGG